MERRDQVFNEYLESLKTNFSEKSIALFKDFFILGCNHNNKENVESNRNVDIIIPELPIIKQESQPEAGGII